MSFGVAQQFRSGSSSGVWDNIQQEIIDLGPGEVLSGNQLVKYKCFRVTKGEIYARSGCLQYRSGSSVFSLTAVGELTKVNGCAMSLRINSTHIIQPSIDDMIGVKDYPLLSLLEEENVLKYPPKVVDSLSYINELVVNSSSLNIRRDQSSGKTFESSVIQGGSTAFVDKLLDFKFFKWLSLAYWCVITAVIVMLAALYGYRGSMWLFTMATSKPEKASPASLLDATPFGEPVETGANIRPPSNTVGGRFFLRA
jgi:hypothetical protein